MDILHVTEENFEEEINNFDGTVLVDFWAVWCTPCTMLAPTLDEISREHGDKVKVIKVNVDEAPALPGRFGIMNIPTMIFFKDGKEVNKLVGIQSKEDIMAAIV